MVSVLALSAVDHGVEPRVASSESVYCVRVERHVYPQTVVSVS
jgi:hypothetical protein